MTSVKLDFAAAAKWARTIGDEAHSMSDFVTLHRKDFEEALIKAYLAGLAGFEASRKELLKEFEDLKKAHKTQGKRAIKG